MADGLGGSSETALSAVGPVQLHSFLRRVRNRGGGRGKRKEEKVVKGEAAAIEINYGGRCNDNNPAGVWTR